ncbi:MAG: NUDIX hydrolase [Flavobacteriales bacterium]
MYKVFIYNSPVFFVEDIKDYFHKINDAVNLSITDVLRYGILRLVNQHSGKAIVVDCYDVEQDFKMVFKDFKIIEAAGGFVENSKGENLYIYRNGFWDLPKGKLENGETWEEGALREVEEECSIHGLISNGLMYITYHVYTTEGKHVLKPTYWFRMVYSGGEKLIPQLEEGIEKAEWRSKNDIQEILECTFGSIKDVIEKGLTVNT